MHTQTDSRAAMLPVCQAPMPLRTALRLAATVLLMVWLAVQPAWAQMPADPGVNTACMACHGSHANPLEVPAADGQVRQLLAIEPDRYDRGVHGAMQCVACHSGIGVVPAPGSGHTAEAPEALKSASCSDCHQRLWDAAQAGQIGAGQPGLGKSVRNLELYHESFHARPSKDDPTRPLATCDNCHDTHSFRVPDKNADDYAEWRLGIPALCGESCHTDALEMYGDSVHGQKVLGERDAKAAVCSDCHTAHAIGNTSADPVKLAITANCGSCHEDRYRSYKATYHGKISTLGYAYTAKCSDCHGSHEILPQDNPDSLVHADNRLDTCRECHSGKKDLALAPASFVSFEPHATTNDFARYPQTWVAWQMMVGLLVGTFGFFWAHTALWFYRELQDRRHGVSSTRVKVSAIPAAAQGLHVRRFSAVWRAAHLAFALSLMVLTLTGMPLFYPNAVWASALMQALGGPAVAGAIHRASAVVFAGVFFWHLFYIALRIWRKRASFRWFGPHSLVPNWQDLLDIVAMFKWFFGQGPRPVFDRWTYWEKFDYWAPFWGVTIIGVSGLIMWLPGLTGQFLPGWVFNVAAIFHGEEAFLAVVFLFTVHFFNNHFRPDKFPLEVVMFTGTMSLAHFRKEHALEYQRLVDSGTLDSVLVQAPSPAMTLGSKVLGFTLIAAGLVLLAGVAVGFFGGG